MHVIELPLPGVLLLSPKIFRDDRGFFRETFRKSVYETWGVGAEFVQDNHSYSTQGVLRGMHFQRTPGQAKLVTVVSGKIYDVVVDMRKHSPTFGKWEGVYLSDLLGEQLYIPEGYAHGFCVMSDEAHVIYKVSSFYDPLEEKSFRFDDSQVGIEWPIDNPLLSEKDRLAPSFAEVVE